MPKASSELKSRRLKICIWGIQSTRKTETPLRYFPNVYAIDTEGNIEQAVGVEEIPPFVYDQEKDAQKICDLLDQVAQGKIKFLDGQPIKTISIDTVSILWTARTDVGAISAEKRAQRKGWNPDEAMMTQVDWNIAKRPLKRMMVRLSNLPVPFLFLLAREKDQYENKPGVPEPIKKGVEPDAMKGLLYDVNVSFHAMKGEDGKVFWKVDKVQGALGKLLPDGSIHKTFPYEILLKYASMDVEEGHVQDEQDLAEKELKELAQKAQAGKSISGVSPQPEKVKPTAEELAQKYPQDWKPANKNELRQWLIDHSHKIDWAVNILKKHFNVTELVDAQAAEYFGYIVESVAAAKGNGRTTA